MSECQQFPDTWEEFEQLYGFTDREEVYTNGSRLIQSFRVKQWLDHIAKPERTAKVVHKSDTYVVTPPKTTTTSYETRTNLWEECGNCHAMGMYHGWNYCPMCGCKLEWE